MVRSSVLKILAGAASFVLLIAVYLGTAAVAPGNVAFHARWERTDDPVLNGVISRTWIWGPEANTTVLTELYAESPGGTRQVQYYDKSRMEINNPSGNANDLFYVTNGLLVVELMTGRRQVGDSSFEQYSPALVNVAGDADDPTGPTYATLAGLRDLPALGDGSVITQRVNRAGVVTNDASLAGQNVRAAQRLTVPGIDHQIAGPFWDFMNSSGTVRVDGQYVSQALFTNPYYATGFPITEAYWASVKVAGTYRNVLMQCFERRCLTYTPGNSEGFVVEAGNVGQHYYSWRYVQNPSAGSPTAIASASAISSSTVTSTASAPTETATTTATSTTATASATATKAPATEYAFVTAWGARHDPASALAGSIAVAVDDNDNVYVADSENNRIQKYTSSGVYITGWGSAGSGDSEFNSPFGIAVDPSGNVYVADTINNRIQKFDANGAYITQWPTNNNGIAPALEPYGIAVGPSGNIFVAASIATNAGVQEYSPAGVYIRQFGSSGTGLGQFEAPWGIAFNHFGQVYVTDIFSDRVQIFTSEGVGIQQFGGAGDGDDEFRRPAGIAIGEDDTVYIADIDNMRVKLHAAGSAYLGVLEHPFASINPVSVATDKDGNLYVGDSVRGVLKFDGQRAYQFSWHDDRRGRFISPDAVAVASDGTLLVVDFDLPRVERFTLDGMYLSEWGSEGTGPGQFKDPVGIAVDSLGQVYVVDSDNDRVERFSAQGVYVSQWGSPGTGDGQFTLAYAIAFDAEDTAYVLDSDAGRVQKFTSDGIYLDQWGNPGSDPGQFADPQDIAIVGGTVYVADTGNNRIQAFDLDGNFLYQWGAAGTGSGQFDNPSGIAVDAQGYVFVSEVGNHRVQKFTPDGAFLATWGSAGTGDGQFQAPYNLTVDAAGNVYVSDAATARIQKFAPVE